MQYSFSNNDFSYRIHTPEGPDGLLADFYCEVSFSSQRTVPFEREILPFPGCEMNFYIHGAASYVDSGSDIKLPRVWLCGQPTTTRKYAILPGTTIFFVRLKQHILKSYLHDQSAWKDTVFELNDKLDLQTATDLEEILQLPDFEARTKLAANIFTNFLNRQPDEYADWLISAESIIKQGIPVATLAAQTFISVRQLERRFKTYFELAPKNYLRLRKLSDALDHYARNAAATVTDASYEGGFADQAHFIKTFRLYATQAPLKFFKRYNLKKQ